jgi:hypothetical protein
VKQLDLSIRNSQSLNYVGTSVLGAQFENCHSPLIGFSLPGIKCFSFDNEEMAIGSELNILLAERKILVKLTLTTEKQQITYL